MATTPTPTRVLVIGSWAKEEITVKNIKRSSEYEVHAYLDTPNPGIIARADEHVLGALTDVARIETYAREKKIDLALVTTAAPLAAGVVDRLESSSITVFGPKRSASRLESDKAFTRELLKRHSPDAIPEFQVCDTVDEAVQVARSMNWRVAVKPIGLTDGLGVRVFEDQLRDEGDVVAYIEEIHTKKIGGHAGTIIEEKLSGPEFTIQCFVHDRLLVPTPAVQDYKKKLPDDRGPNTASMGSYADAGYLLPFMTLEDLRIATGIIETTLAAFREETGVPCTGFLYGQFMKTAKGVRLIEYNFRPGDPEWMNTVFVLNANIADIAFHLLAGRPVTPSFIRLATVCKYIVPPAYPEKLDQTLGVVVDPDKIKACGAEMYWSAGLDRKGRIRVGSERGIAFLAGGATVESARQQLDRALNTVKGDFYHREDIGTKSLIHKSVSMVRGHLPADIPIRHPRPNDFLEISRFVASCPPLEPYPAHIFKILLRYFHNTCYLAGNRDAPVGFLMGFISQTQEPKTYFLWQIGISPLLRGCGLSKKMLIRLEQDLIALGVHRVELTIDPNNPASQALFENMEYTNVSKEEGDTCTVSGQTAVKDYYSPGRHFMLYRKEI